MHPRAPARQTLRHAIRRAIRPGIVAAATLALVLAAVRPAAAQEAQEATPDIPDAELRDYAEVFVQIVDIQAAMKADIEEAGSEEEEQRIKKEANEEMFSAIREDEELTFRRYKEITGILQRDSTQMEEFKDVVREIREEDEDEPPRR